MGSPNTSATTVRPKARSLGVIVTLNMATLGLYSIYWWYVINRELRDLGRSREALGLGESPVLSALALGLGTCLVIPGVWTAVTTNRRIARAERLVGMTEGFKAWVAVGLLTGALVVALTVTGSTALALVARLALIVALESGALVYMQSRLNTIWGACTDVAAPGAEVAAASSVA